MSNEQKHCGNCLHSDPADRMLCTHPTRQCGGFMWSAYQFLPDEPSCYDDSLEAPRGWEPQP